MSDATAASRSSARSRGLGTHSRGGSLASGCHHAARPTEVRRGRPKAVGETGRQARLADGQRPRARRRPAPRPRPPRQWSWKG